MQTSKLNNSIYIVWTFLFLVILQHIAAVFTNQDVFISTLIISFTLAVAIVFWIQFYFNFRNYLKIDDIRIQITSIVIVDAVLLLIYAFYAIDSARPVPLINKTSDGILEGISLICRIILLISNMHLGFKFYNQKNSPELRSLGLSLIFRMIATFGTEYFKTNPILKPIYHIFILFEVLPWWYTYIIYRKIMISENVH